jgi:hypothetical protein
VATAAFELFGIHPGSLTLVMLILMSLSAAIFLTRFREPVFAGLIILYFGALTVMLFTSLVWDPSYNINIPVDGIRYFSLVGVVPMFHILFELLAPTRPTKQRRDFVFLSVQVVILVIAMLVRGSTLPLIGGIALVWVVLFFRRRHNFDARRTILRKGAVIGVVAFGVVAAIAISVPRYLKEGRFGTVIWQRVTESIGTHNDWPFPGVNEMFDCEKYVPGGLRGGFDDNNGACIWFDYITKHNIPIESIGDKTFGGLYEAALRQAFFRITARYPREVLETFVYYKPRMILQSISNSLQFNFNADASIAVYPLGPKLLPYPSLSIALLFASLALAILYFCVATIRVANLRLVAGVTLLSALFTIPAYLAAWAIPPTSADLLLYCLIAIGLAFGALISFLRSLFQKRIGLQKQA